MQLSNIFNRERLIGVQDYLIGSIFFFTPIFSIGLTLRGLSYEKFSLFFIILCLILAIHVGLGISSGWFSRTKFDIPIVILAASMLLSFLFSASFIDSLFGSFNSPEVSVIAILSYLFLYYMLARSERAVQISTWLLIASVSIIALLGALSFFGVITPDIFIKLLGSNLAAAEISLMVIPLFILMAWKMSNIGQWRTIALRSMLIMSGLGLLIVVLTNFTFPKSFTSSQQYWRLIFGGIKHNSLLGTGPGTKQLAIAKYRTYDNTLPATAPDTGTISISPFLGLFLTLGLVGLLAFSFFVYSFWQAGKQAILLSEGVLQTRNIALILGSAIAAIFIAVSPSSIVFLFGTLVIILSLASISVTLDATIVDVPSSGTRWRKVGGMSAIFVLACLAGITVTQVVADALAKKSIQGEAQDERILFANQALNLAPLRPEYNLVYAKLTLMRGYQLMAEKNSDSLNDFRRAFVAASRAIVLSPENGDILREAGQILESVSIADATAISYAEQLYRKLVKIEPNNPEAYHKLALIFETAGGLSSQDKIQRELFGNALVAADQSILLFSNFVDARLTRARIKDKLGLFDEAMAETRSTAAINPLPNVEFELARRLYNRGVNRKGQIMRSNVITPPSLEKLDLDNDNDNTRLKMNIDLQESLQILLELKKENPTFSNALYTLVMLEYRLGKTAEAKQDLIDLLRIIPTAEHVSIKSQFQGL